MLVVCTSATYSSNPCAAALKKDTGPPLFCENVSWLCVLLHHRIGVFPDTGVDEFVVADRFLIWINGPDLFHEGGNRLDLVAGHSVILGSPEVDVEKRLERRFVHFLVVTRDRSNFSDRIGVLRILHKFRRFDHSGDGPYNGVAVLC